MRKELNLDVEQHIHTQVDIPKDQQNALSEWKEYIANETRSKPLEMTSTIMAKHQKKWKINEIDVHIGIKT
jgi:hypothetical protein